MLDTLNSVDRGAMEKSLFAGLTYPSEFPDVATAKRHLDTWLKRLERRYPRASAVWRLEFQRRGAPHFHLLIFGVPWLDLEWLKRSWYEVVGSGDVQHLGRGTDVARVRSFRAAMAYAAKYMSKSCDDGQAAGRVWGVFNGEALPVHMIRLALTLLEFYRVRRFLRCCLEHRARMKFRPGRDRYGGIKCYMLGGELLRWLFE